ncbi:hypothetical protein CS0771_16610 [Catellatospora sp. IY07-71]|nr:hypothetical protein CS0771_16610 [Catellatospora sp. IY07-71]
MIMTDPTETAAGPSPAALASGARRLLRPPVPADAEMRDAGLFTQPQVNDAVRAACATADDAGLTARPQVDGHILAGGAAAHGAGLAAPSEVDGAVHADDAKGHDETGPAAGPRCMADAGMNTAEYAVGTLAAVAFAGILLKVLTSDSVQAALAGVIQRALG